MDGSDPRGRPTTDGGSTDRERTVASVVEALVEGDYGAATDHVAEEHAGDLPEAWARMVDTFGAVESVGTPDTDDDGTVRLPLELESGDFEFVAAFDDAGGQAGGEADGESGTVITRFRVTTADGGTLSTLAVLARSKLGGATASLKRAVPGLSAGPLPDGDRSEQARWVVEALDEGCYGDVYEAMGPTARVALDRESFAATVGGTYERKAGDVGAVAVEYDGREDRAYVVPEERNDLWLEVNFGDGPVIRGLAVNDYATVVEMVASRGLRAGDGEVLRENWTDPVPDEDTLESLFDAWDGLGERLGPYEGVAETAAPAPDRVEATVEFEAGTCRLGLWTDDRRDLTRLALETDGETVWDSDHY